MFDSAAQRIGMLFLIECVGFHIRKIELNGIGCAAIVEFGQEPKDAVTHGQFGSHSGW